MNSITMNIFAATTGNSWKWIYRLGAIAVLIAMSANLADIILGFGGTEMVTYGTISAIEWFEVYQDSWFRGVDALGILNIFYMVAILPVYFALFGVYFEKQAVAAALTLVIFLTAMSMYISNNAAIPLLGLSGKYSPASSELERNIHTSIIAIAAGS